MFASVFFFFRQKIICPRRPWAYSSHIAQEVLTLNVKLEGSPTKFETAEHMVDMTKLLFGIHIVTDEKMKSDACMD